ncbi:MAG: putative sporulation protein YtxC [Firmicutes bacterium]|jgi:putative sporulation protein YtxC|nr:putative sporulation protein YtxC [Bacillota bacterium]
MQVVSIGTARHADQILERLNYEFKFLQEEGINIDVQQTNRGNLTFLGCKLVRGGRTRFSAEDSITLLKHFIANALSDVIVNDWESALIRKIVRDDYSHFPKDERDGILEFIQKNLDGRVAGENDLFHRVNRKGRVLSRLIEYLNRHSELVLEGFVAFRLKDYVEELHESVSRAVDEYLLEKEYKEFIRLLRHFVDAQEPKFDEIHAVVVPGGWFKLSDREGRPVAREYLEDLVTQVRDADGDCEGLLISSLITLAPLSVVLHLPPGSDDSMGTETIKKIFGDRVKICGGCERCGVRGDARDLPT